MDKTSLKNENKLLITSEVLDVLGFSEYWDEHGTWGGRTLTFANGERYRIIEQEEMDDDTEGYGDGNYVSHHFYYAGWFAIEKQDGHDDLFFLHEMQESITKRHPNCLAEFIDKCNKNKMAIYLLKSEPKPEVCDATKAT